MPNISFAMGMFSYKKKNGIIFLTIGQWVHLFSMDFDDSRPFFLCFSLKLPFSMIKSLLSGNNIHILMTFDEGIRCNSTRV